MQSAFKSIVSSIQTATTSYFSPQHKAQARNTRDSRSSQSARMAPDNTGRKGLFNDVVFYDSSSALEDRHRNLLEAGGAVEYIPEGSEIDWSGITHVFTRDIDFPGRQEAVKQPGLAIMTARWIELTAARNVLQNPKNFSPDPKMFFSGLVVTCAELPEGDREAIFGGFSANGGMYDDVLRTTTTHVIALNVDNEKCRKAMKEERLGIKIVLPHWFDDCLKLRRRVDEKPYLLPDPPLFKAFAAQNRGANVAEPASSDHLQYTHFGSIQSQSDPPDCTATIFQGNHQTVFLAKDLGVSTRLRETLEHVVQRAGGKLVPSVQEAQVYIGSWREKEDYIRASRKGAVVGNLTWLYYMLANDRWISPRCHLLHYPLVRGGMSEMKSMIMTVTNYQGEARAYLEKLIEACGAKFTRNMTTANTHLIAASKNGDKCKHAHDWGIDVVNHLWLEETYAKWQVQSVSIRRYTHFPPQTNLTEIVDKTEIQEEGILDFFQLREDEEEEMLDVNPVAANETSKSQNVQSSYVPGEKSTPAPAAKGPRKVGREPQTPALHEPSVRTPGSTGRRKAAENAANKLHDVVMPDLMLWNKEKHRKRLVEVPSPAEEERRKTEKRKSEEKENHTEGPQKKARKEKVVGEGKDATEQSNKITLLITGAHQDFINATSIKKLSRLGIKIITEGGFCTHLAAPHILRTEKFLCALAYAPTVVSLNWVEDCMEKDKLLDLKDYLLRDPENEEKYDTTLEQTMSKARLNKRQLFKHYQIYLSTNVASHSSLLRIVEANGGEARIVSHTIKARAKVLRSDYLKTAENQILISSSAKDDKFLQGKFMEEVEEGELKGAIYSSEWIMRSVLRQEIADDEDICLG